MTDANDCAGDRLYAELVVEYQRRAEDYRISKRAGIDNALIPALAIINALQRVLERAGYPPLPDPDSPPLET